MVRSLQIIFKFPYDCGYILTSQQDFNSQVNTVKWAKKMFSYANYLISHTILFKQHCKLCLETEAPPVTTCKWVIQNNALTILLYSILIPPNHSILHLPLWANCSELPPLAAPGEWRRAGEGLGCQPPPPFQAALEGSVPRHSPQLRGNYQGSHTWQDTAREWGWEGTFLPAAWLGFY